MATFFRSILFIMMLTVLNGCGTSFHIVPEVAVNEVAVFSLVGHVEYDGNADYLPRTVKQCDDNACVLLIKYTYDVAYGKDAIPDILPLFNPLSLFGFPIGSDSIVIVGVMEIIREGEILKKYSSSCLIDKNRSLFYEGKTFSDLRRKGLLMVRGNIENQIFNDKVLLSNLIQ